MTAIAVKLWQRIRAFGSYRPSHLIYLLPIRLGDERLPPGQVRILCCDSKGKLVTTIIADHVYEAAKSYIRELDYEGKYYAILDTEVSKGKFAPMPVTIDSEQAWALERILYHALTNRVIPYVLREYPKQIASLVDARRTQPGREVVSPVSEAEAVAQSQILAALSDYHDEVEVPIPIYKARYRYPLVILKRLPPSEEENGGTERALVLDSEGDLAIIKVPSEIIGGAEEKLKAWERSHNRFGCIICSRGAEGLAMSQMEIDRFQKKALDVIAQYFERTGQGQRPISADAEGVLSMARAKASTMFDAT
jgi:hypothetical protein